VRRVAQARIAIQPSSAIATYLGVSSLVAQMGGKNMEPRHRIVLTEVIATLEDCLRQIDDIGLADMALKLCHAIDIGRKVSESVQNEPN
jgi:hypothetical protein